MGLLIPPPVIARSLPAKIPHPTPPPDPCFSLIFRGLSVTVYDIIEGMKRRFCAVCNSSLWGLRADARYCRAACRVRAWRWRNLPPGVLRGMKRWARMARGVLLRGRALPRPHNPASFMSWQRARRSRLGDGYALMLGGGICCYTIPDALTRAGRLKRKWLRFIKTLGNSYLWAQHAPTPGSVNIITHTPHPTPCPGARLDTRGRAIEITEKPVPIT